MTVSKVGRPRFLIISRRFHDWRVIYNVVSKSLARSSHCSTADQYPLGYLITFTCYGTFLHGDERTSVDRHHCGFDTPRLPPNTARLQTVQRQLKQAPYRLDQQRRRQIVLEALKEACCDREWLVFALHVRSNHVHAVLHAETKPETILKALKGRGSRRLTRAGVDPTCRKRWTRHGSTQYLWREEDVNSAIEYVVERQGEKMAVYDWRVDPTIDRARGLKPTALLFLVNPQP